MLNQTDLRKEIYTFFKHVPKKYKVSKVILFGSYARGNADQHSDIDLAIFSPSVRSEAEAFKALTDFVAATKFCHVPIEPLLYPQRYYNHYEPQGFIDEIMRYGKEIKLNLKSAKG